MTDIETVDERLRAVERAIADGDGSDVQLTDPTGELADRIDRLETDVAELDAAVQAVRGYVGHVRAVDETVEREADSALAAVDAVQARVQRLEDRIVETDGTPRERRRAPHSEPPQSDGVDRSTHVGSDADAARVHHRKRRDGSCPHCGGRQHPTTPARRPHTDGGWPASAQSADEEGERRSDGEMTEAPVDAVDESGLVERLRDRL